MNPVEEVYRKWKADPLDINLEKRLYNALTHWAQAIVWVYLKEHDPDVVANIVHDALFKERTHFDNKSMFTTWFHRCAVNDCLQVIAKRQGHGHRPQPEGTASRKEVSLDRLAESGFEPEAPEKDSEAAEELGALDVTDDERRLIDLTLAAGGMLDRATMAVISKQLGLSPDGVRTRWDRLKRRLRDAREQSG